MRAVRAKDLVIAGVDKVSSGRYKLKVPAGTYWLFGATTPLRGKDGVDPGGGQGHGAQGEEEDRRRLDAQAQAAPRRRSRASRTRAQCGFMTVKYPAVWVQHFSAPAEFRQLRQGISGMLISDICSRSRRRATASSSSARSSA